MERMKKEISEAVTSDVLSDGDWKNIFRIINTAQFFTADESDFWECIYIITGAFQAKQCKDISVVWGTLFLAFLKNYFNTFFDESFPIQNVEDIMDIFPLPGESTHTSSIFHDIVNWSNRSDLVIETLLSGNIDFLKVVLDFGNFMTPPKDLSDYSTDILKSLLETYEQFPPLLNGEANIDRFIKDPDERNRLYLLWTTLSILTYILQYPDTAEDMVGCTRLFFNYFPFTRITSRKLRQHLEKVLKGLSMEQLINEIVKDYEYFFPESTNPCTPRSLQHLCRCRVQESLRNANTIWYGVPLLPLPKLLKKYILPEIEEN